MTGGIDAGMKERDDTVQVITYELFMSHIRMTHIIHMNESCHTYE